MRAMVLCAGLGTRLRPLSTLWPKPAMPLLGQPLLRYALATLKSAGITGLAINTHHLPEVMSKVAKAECARAGISLTIVHEAGEIQGTGGGIRGLRDFLSGGDFVVLNGDVLFGVDLAPIVEAHRAGGALATMVLLPMPEGERFNPVEVDTLGFVRRIAGKGPKVTARLTPWHFSGVHVMTPAVFEQMAKEGPQDINHDVYVRLLEKGLPLRAHLLTSRDTFWSDLGTPARYAATHEQLLLGQVPVGPFGTASPFIGAPRGPGNFWAHPTAKLQDVKVSGPAWFGEWSELGRGVKVGACVSIGPRARVGDGAMLNRVAVLDGAEVQPGVLLEDAIVAPGGMIVSTREP